MRRIICFMLFVLTALTASAQDSLLFKGRVVNDEYQVWIDMDFERKNVTVPDQELFGELPGYLGARRDTRKWLILDTEVNGRQAGLTIINDYGSDDLTSRFTRNDDGTYTLEQLDGSPLRIVVNNKWVKLPKRLVFHREKK